MPKHETRNILLNKLGSKHNLIMKFGQFIWPEKILSKDYMRNVTWKLIPGLF